MNEKIKKNSIYNAFCKYLILKNNYYKKKKNL